MSEYTNARRLAERMIRLKGAVITLTRTTPGAYDPATSTTAAATVATYSGSAFRGNYSLKEVDGTRVLATDVRFLFSPLTRSGGEFPAPMPSTDVLTFVGKDFTVVNCDSWCFDGTNNVGFSVQARGVQ